MTSGRYFRLEEPYAQLEEIYAGDSSVQVGQ